MPAAATRSSASETRGKAALLHDTLKRLLILLVWGELQPDYWVAQYGNVSSSGASFMKAYGKGHLDDA